MSVVPSLTTQAAISLLSNDSLEAIVREVEKYKYYYILVIEGIDSVEYLDTYDLRYLEPIMAKPTDEHSTAEIILDKLYEDDKVIKFLCGDLYFREYLDDKTIDYIDSEVDEDDLAIYIRKNLDKTELIKSIANATIDSIMLYNSKFRPVMIRIPENEDGLSDPNQKLDGLSDPYILYKVTRPTELSSYKHLPS